MHGVSAEVQRSVGTKHLIAYFKHKTTHLHDLNLKYMSVIYL